MRYQSELDSSWFLTLLLQKKLKLDEQKHSKLTSFVFKI